MPRVLLEINGKQTSFDSLETAQASARGEKGPTIWVEYDPEAPTRDAWDELTKALAEQVEQNARLRQVIEARHG